MAREPLAVQARNRFLGFHEELKRLLGSEFRPYKPLEVDRLDRAFASILRSRKRGPDWVCEAIARLTWDQALPNVNHRTTLGFVQAMMVHAGIIVPWAVSSPSKGPAYDGLAESWMKRSKAIMGDRDMWQPNSKPWKELQEKHRNATRKWIEEQDQSGSLASTGPHSLRNFLSSSVKTGRGLG